jgi:Flp pilus assembly protein TadD
MIAALLLAARGIAAPDAMEHFRAGSQAFVEQRFGDAIESLKQSLALNPKQLRALRLLGLSYQLAGKLDQAETTFRDAIRLAPEDGESWFFLGRVYYLQNYFDKAAPALRTAAKHAPSDPRVRECLALTLEATGDPLAAEREYKQGLQNPGAQRGTLSMNFGALLLKLNRTQESEQMLVNATGLMPKFWQAHFELARLYYQTHRFEPALKELTTALDCTPNADEAARTHRLMAVVYANLGRHEEARRSAAASEK